MVAGAAGGRGGHCGVSEGRCLCFPVRTASARLGAPAPAVRGKAGASVCFPVPTASAPLPGGLLRHPLRPVFSRCLMGRCAGCPSCPRVALAAAQGQPASNPVPGGCVQGSRRVARNLQGASWTQGSRSRGPVLPAGARLGTDRRCRGQGTWPSCPSVTPSEVRVGRAVASPQASR